MSRIFGPEFPAARGLAPRPAADPAPQPRVNAAPGRADGPVNTESAPDVSTSAATQNVPWEYDSLMDHFQRHGQEFGCQSADAYEQAAHDFYQHRNEYDSTNGRDGRIRCYDAASNTFAVFRSNGEPVTLFKPRQKGNYWEKQKRR